MTYVWDQSRQTGTHLLMMLAIADHANDAGECWPVIDRLARKCRVNRRQARKILKTLEDAGELRIQRGQGRGHPSVYLVIGVLQDPFHVKEVPQNPLHEEKGVHRPPIETRKGVLQDQEKGFSRVPALKNARAVLRHTSLEPSEEKEKEDPSLTLPAGKGTRRQAPRRLAGFEAWWLLYPEARRIHKAGCLALWRHQGLEARAQDIQAHTTGMIQTEQWRAGKIPNSTTYLKETRYEQVIPCRSPAFKDEAGFLQILTEKGLLP